MFSTFNELWEACEKFQAPALITSSNQEDMTELSLKFAFYKSLSEKEPTDILKQSKIRLMGEILFLLTKISAREDINTFTALNQVLEYRQMEKDAQKLF